MRILLRELWNLLRASLAVGTELALLATALWLIVPCIPPRPYTATTMWVMKRRIIQHALAHGALPTSVDQLPEMKGYHNSVKDA